MQTVVILEYFFSLLINKIKEKQQLLLILAIKFTPNILVVHAFIRLISSTMETQTH